MPYQNISATLTETDLQAIRTSIASITAKLPFLITLLPAERRKAIKLTAKGPDFLDKVMMALKDHPEIVPGTFNLPEFEKDVTLLLQLVEILGLVNVLSSALNDTIMALGNESMTGGNRGYSLLQDGAEVVPGLKATVKEIGKFYENRGPKKPPNPPTP